MYRITRSDAFVQGDLRAVRVALPLPDQEYLAPRSAICKVAGDGNGPPDRHPGLVFIAARCPHFTGNKKGAMSGYADCYLRVDQVVPAQFFIQQVFGFRKVKPTELYLTDERVIYDAIVADPRLDTQIGLLEYVDLYHVTWTERVLFGMRRNRQQGKCKKKQPTKGC